MGCAECERRGEKCFECAHAVPRNEAELAEKLPKKRTCRFPGCSSPKREGKVTCQGHAEFDQWVVRSLHYGVRQCPCYPGPKGQ